MYDQFEDRRVGLRFCTFTTPVQDLGNDCKVITSFCPCYVTVTLSERLHCLLENPDARCSTSFCRRSALRWPKTPHRVPTEMPGVRYRSTPESDVWDERRSTYRVD